ncbi:aspartate/glutamate racemase family protein [Caproiciproducens faecalis]|uniref:Aspartate/glutamate racemase family protein n=1 Tax=Caproiciproducens faecalis TaxID=2820301 RepID=A0ABS7DLJ8_9FIRM|nr:aspartate/glutamate racemase family protein [Caproiciproducens faecalis]MBW7572188.1 aspartate/glutamate racemase family protein [Caproiciproducens faecalis]
MKTIGLIGGMSWESTVSYYQIINRTVQEKLGGFHSAKCLLYSVDFHEIEKCQEAGDWEKCGEILSSAAKSLEKGGADFIIICTNTMHKVLGQIQSAVSIPVLHIAEVTAEELLQNKIRKVALLGTIYTMEQDFYKEKLREKNLEVLVPEEEDRKIVNHIIFHELCLGVVSEESKAAYLKIIDKLAAKGAQGVILGCTEIGILIQQQDTSIPLFDTTEIHAKRAALYALS